jgi:hypothetical protein
MYRRTDFSDFGSLIDLFAFRQVYVNGSLSQITNMQLDLRTRDYFAFHARRYRVSSSDPEVWCVAFPIGTRRRLGH